MTAEQLNIKMNLDIGDLLSDVKKVKAQLTGVASSVKNSIPKISSESKSASNALSGVTRASNKVKESLDDIGDEARDSLGDVVKYSKTAATALKSMKNSSDNTKFNIDTDGMAEGADDINTSFESIQTTMQGIMGLNLWQALGGPLDKFKKKMQGVKDMLPDLKSAFDQIFVEGDGGWAWDWDEVKDSFRKSLDSMKKDAKKGIADMKESFSILKYDITSIFETDGWKNFKKNLASCTKAVVGLTLKVVALASAISAVALAINAIKISELGKEIYNNAQRCGMSAQTYQEWAYVLQRAGVEADELKEVVKTLTEAQVDVINGSEDMITAFKQLGLSAEEVAGMSQQQLWTETIRRLQNVANVTQRTAIAYKLFGEDASKLTTILNLSNEQTQELIGTYNQLGGVMSQELLHNSQVLQGSLSNLGAAWQGLKNTLAQAVIPVIITLVDWITTAIAAVNAFLQVFFGLDLTPATENLAGGFTAGIGAVGGYEDAVESAGGAVEKLKRSIMGFDELNVVPAQDTSSGGGGGVAGGGGEFEMPELGNANSIFQEASKQAEELKKKITSFIEEYKTQIAIIGAALGALGIAKLLEHLGKALGLGDKFLGFVKGIQKLATTAITITLQYTLANEFFDSFIDGEGIKKYLLGLLVSAIGTGVLYSMWGPAGAVIGLLVTAVAGFKAVFDNGGITNVESAVVAFTSLGAAIAALGVAWKKLGMAKWVASIKEWLAAAKLMAPEVGILAAYFPKLSLAIGKVGSAFAAIGTAAKAALAAIGGLVGGGVVAGAAIVAAAIAAIAGVVVFLKQNWEEMGTAVKNFFNENIAPKFEAIKEAIVQMGQAIASVIPDGLKQILADIWQGIKNVISAIAEWFASIDWLKGIGTIFEWLGGIIVGVVGGVIAGAINGLVSLIQGACEIISGAVKIVAGVVQAIISLLTGDLKKAKDGVKKIADGIVSCFKGLYNATIGVIVNLVKGVIDWFTEMWDVLVGHSIVPDMVNAIIKWFLKLPTEIFKMMANFVQTVIQKFTELAKAAVDKFKEIVENIKNAWTNVKKTWDVAGKYFGDIWSNIKKTFSETAGWFKNVFQTAWNNIKSIFNNVTSYFTGVWNSIKNIFSNVGTAIANGISGAVRGAINAVLRTVTNKINGFISMINGAISIINKIPGVSVGYVSQLSVPQLAKGGIVTSETLARIGEGGRKEAVLPLEQNTGWMDKLADKINAKSGANEPVIPANIILQIDGRQLGVAAIDNINAITKQQGRLMLHLV